MNHKVRLSVLCCSMVLLSGCGVIKEAFPDKEKDYRYTHEIPEIVVPNNLGQQANSVTRSMPEAEIIDEPVMKQSMPIIEPPKASTQFIPSPKVAAPSVKPQPNIKAEQAKVKTLTKPEAAEQTPAPNANGALQTTPLQETPIEVSKYAESVADADAAVAPVLKLRKTSERTAVLHFNQNEERTWRIVGKALTQQAVEISERNTKAHYFTVQYEPQAKALKDDSIWDDIGFIFGAENNQEQSYRIALTEKDKQTEIRVLDAENKVCSTDACIQLTKLLQTAIEKAMKD